MEDIVTNTFYLSNHTTKDTFRTYYIRYIRRMNYLYFYLTPPGQLDTFVLCGVRLVCYLLGLGVPNGQGAHVWDVCV